MRPSRPDAGFTLVELLVAMGLIALVLGGAITMFNYTNELARAQLHQSDLQQSGRVAQREMLANLRMAGRGGLPGYHLHGFDAASGPASDTPAISVTSNVALGTRIVPGDATSPRVQLGTDILTVRGHFNSPPLYVNSTDPTTFNHVDGSGGTVVISSHIAGEVMQDMTAIIEAVNDNRADAILLVSNLTDEVYGVAELNPAGSIVPDPYVPDPNNEITITIAYTLTGTRSAAYGLLSADGVFPDSSPGCCPDWLPPRDLTGVGIVALLEEYRYYIEDPTDAEPRLVRGRFFPGTQIGWQKEAGDDPLWNEVIADNILDLQVALGFDSSFDGTNSQNGFFDFDLDNLGPDDIIFDADFEPTGDTSADDWLFNDPRDLGALASLPWTPNPAAGPTPPSFTVSQPRPRLYYARVTTLAMSSRPNRGYQAPVIASIEDHVYPQNITDPVNSGEGRARRRLLLTSVVDLRNL